MEVVCANLRKVYPDGKEALTDVSFSLQAGLFGLLGPNGAGKTTLMEILTLLLEPTSGRLLVDGIDSRQDPMAIRQRLGYLPQFFGFFPELTAREFLEYLGALRGMKGRRGKETVQDLLDKVRLTHVQNKRLKTFSGGMLRRVGIAQAMLGNPSLIIVDEPTAGLDPEERVNVRNLLFELGQERIVILSTHIVKDIEETCSKMALLLNGRICFEGSPTAFVGAAKGETWEFYGEPEDIEAYSGRPELVSVREEVRGICFRVVAPSAPRSNAVRVRPNLEDAYVRFLQREGAVA